MISAPSSKGAICTAGWYGDCEWTTEDFIWAHKEVAKSGKFNYELCKIPIPTSIRYDRLEEALGDTISPKEQKVLSLVKYGMPLDCDVSFGVRSPQKNHFSAICYEKEVSSYLEKGMQSNAILGPFDQSPILDLSFSPLMSVPKDVNKRRIIVDFSFPPSRSINDGISKVCYLDSLVEFSLPSVQSMVARLNTLGRGCLMYKKDLSAAFRQFGIDPGDYKCTGLIWNGKVFIDTRLAMGLRCSAFCCQSVTELVAKVAGKKGHVLVYLDDFGGADLAGKAHDTFKHLGWLIEHF